MIIRKRIDLQGIVQGVGFRPYVFRLATEKKLAGVISNTSSGVTVEVEGSAEVVDEFVCASAAGAAAAGSHHPARRYGSFRAAAIRTFEFCRAAETSMCRR